MATNSALSPEYLAQSKTRTVTVMYAIPIALEAISTGWRLGASVSGPTGPWLAFDDYLMLFATLVAMVVCAVGLVYGPPHGLGRHIEAIPKHDVQMFLKGDYIFSHFYDVAIAFTKLSVLALYYRIFATAKFRLIITFTACWVIAWVVTIEVALGFGCRPIQAWWGETKGTCINKEAFTYFTNATNMATDLWVFMMPIPVILGLQTAREKKVILCLMFGMGLATCAISAARLTFVFGVASVDFTWDEASLGILSAWEPCGAILCANLPQIFRHLVIIRDTLLAGVRTATSYGSGSGSGKTGVSSDRQGGYKGSLKHPDWALSHSECLMGETSGTVTEVSAQKPPDTAAELDELSGGGIMVERALTQFSAQDVEAAAVMREKNEN